MRRSPPCVNVHVEVLGVLIGAEVGEDRGRSVFIFHAPGDGLDHVEERADVGLVFGAGCGEGGDVALGHHDDVDLPERAGVMERQDLVVFVYDAELLGVRDGDVAVEIGSGVRQVRGQGGLAYGRRSLRSGWHRRAA